MEQENNVHRHHSTNPERMINLTDGVFAIILTLLILEVKIPENPNGMVSDVQFLVIFKI